MEFSSINNLANAVTISKEQLVNGCELWLSLKATFFLLEISKSDHTHDGNFPLTFSKTQ